MLEQTREIVRSFNSIYGDVLVEPDYFLKEGRILDLMLSKHVDE